MENTRTFNFSEVDTARETFMENHKRRMAQIEESFTSIENSRIGIEAELADIDRMIEENGCMLDSLLADLKIL